MAHSFSSVLVHLIFSTKDRAPLILPKVEKELHAYLGQCFQTLECPSLAINGTSDHLHVLFRLGRRQSVADVVEEAKTSSSKWMKSTAKELEKFYWQGGYGAFSIGESGVLAVKRYIERQKEHHRVRTYQEEFVAFLAKYRVPYDERYVWE